MTYCTTTEVLESLNWLQESPEFISGSTPVIEEVDNSGTLADGSIIYLDHNRCIDTSLVLAYGADVDNLTDLTLTTDYTFDNDSGKITITAAGAIAIGANSVFAKEYKFIEVDGRTSIKESFITAKIDAAVELIDLYCQQTFKSPTTVVREQHYGKGRYDLLYRPNHLLASILTPTLTTGVDDSITTFVISDTTGLLVGEYITIESEVVSIDSVDDSTTLTVTRGALDSTAAAHSATVDVINMVVEINATGEGIAPSFAIQQYGSDWTINKETSAIQISNSVYTGDIVSTSYPTKYLQNKVQLTYSYGRSSIPALIRDACILQVSRWMLSFRLAKSGAEGAADYAGQNNTVLDSDIKTMIKPNILMLGSSS